MYKKSNPPIPENVFFQHFSESGLYEIIDSLFTTNTFKVALTQDIYIIMCSYWKTFVDEDDDTPSYIKVFDADKMIKEKLKELFTDIYPDNEKELFEDMYTSYKDSMEDSKDPSAIDFSIFILCLILSSGIVKKNLKRAYKTTTLEDKEGLVALIGTTYVDLCSQTAKQHHPDFPGLRPLNALEIKNVLKEPDFINSFKKKIKRIINKRIKGWGLLLILHFFNNMTY